MVHEQPADDALAAPFDDYSDVVLYNVMYDTNTQLGGTLVALYYQAKNVDDDAGVRHWLRRRRAIQRERDAVRGTDRPAQVAAIIAWRDELHSLRPLLPEF